MGRHSHTHGYLFLSRGISYGLGTLSEVLLETSLKEPSDGTFVNIDYQTFSRMAISCRETWSSSVSELGFFFYLAAPVRAHSAQNCMVYTLKMFIALVLSTRLIREVTIKKCVPCQ